MYLSPTSALPVCRMRSIMASSMVTPQVRIRFYRIIHTAFSTFSTRCNSRTPGVFLFPRGLPRSRRPCYNECIKRNEVIP